MKITFVVPTYNEAENLPKLVSALFTLPVDGLNLLVVDDNSPDGTGQLAEQLGKEWNGRVQVIHRAGKLGLGSAYIQGFKQALQQGADAVGQMDADFSHPIEKIPEMVASLPQADVIIGSRYVKGGSLDENWPLSRKILSGFGNFYARTILRLPMRDVTGGFRLWKRGTLESMPLDRVKASGFIFQVEMAYIAYKLGFTFCEIPIYFADRQLGQSKMSIWIQIEAALKTWGLLWRYRDLKRKTRR